MPAPKVKADYHLLDLIAAQFSREAELAQQMFDLLSKQMSSLESGDWVGQGANAFYSEMHNQVLPALVRLRDAMRHSAGVTRQIRQIMQAAEIEAAAIFWVFGVLFGGKAAPRITYRASSIAQPLDEATKAFWESRWNRNKKNGDDTNLDKIRIVKGKDGKYKLFAFMANMAIDDDGTLIGITDGKSFDKHHQDKLPASPRANWIDPREVPYIALPAEFGISAKEGDLVLVRYKDHSVYAIVADAGPSYRVKKGKVTRTKAGEASIRTARALGLGTDPNRGGLDEKNQGVEYIVLPGTGHAHNMIGKKRSFDEIQDIGAQEFARAKKEGLIDE